MIRGTTPLHEFELPFSVDMLEEVEITYSQKDKEVLTKTIKDCTLSDKTVSVQLTQEDTFKFVHGVNVEIQIRVKTFGNDVPASDVIQVSCDKCLSNRVL